MAWSLYRLVTLAPLGTRQCVSVLKGLTVSPLGTPVLLCLASALEGDSPTSFMTLGKSLHFSELQFSCLQKGWNELSTNL